MGHPILEQLRIEQIEYFARNGYMTTAKNLAALSYTGWLKAQHIIQPYLPMNLHFTPRIEVIRMMPSNVYQLVGATS